MPAVTQLTPNFLGGVSRQNDDKKLDGQVTECINGYPDPTYGLLKRPGMGFTDVLKNAAGTAFTQSELEDAAWFTVERGPADSYIGAIKGTNIYVWSAAAGTWCTVTNVGPVLTVDNLVGGTGYANATNVATTGGTGTGLTVNITTAAGVITAVAVNNAGTGYAVDDTITVTGGNTNGTFDVATITQPTTYLTGTQQNDYHFRSVQDVTVITNKTVTTAMKPSGTFVANSVATVILKTLVDSYVYKVTLQGIDIEVTAQATTTYDQMLKFDGGDINTSNHLIDAVRAGILAQQGASNANFSGRWYLEGYTNSLVIKRSAGANAVVTDYSAVTGTPLAFTVDAEGGFDNISLFAWQDEVNSVADLPVESFHDHNFRITNSSIAEDDYYVKFVAENGVGGRGGWQETLARNVSPGLDVTTMPHALVNTGDTTFTFGPIVWAARTAGDDVTSPVPSFVNFKVTSSFFYNNRFGILSEDNIIFGVANDPYNFFVRSALTQIASDPIDLNVSSVRPVSLSDVLPSPQGLTVFSERQQFQVFTTDGSILTPTSATVRAISNYEMDTSMAPVDVGTTAAFVSKVPGYSKVFTLQLQDIEQNPIVVDISKVVLQWIPATADIISVSPQNSLILLADSDTSFMYLFRYFNNGKEDLFRAWTKWQLPGTIQWASIVNDTVFVISQHENEYTFGKIVLDEIPTGDVVATANGANGNPCLDMFTRPVEPAEGVAAVVYDEANDVTKIYTPYTPFQQRDAVMLLTVPLADVDTDDEIAADAGYWAVAKERTETDTGYRYFEVKGNFTDYADGIVVGYKYDFEVTLPKFYFRRDAATTDFTATLTISRVKFSVGKTGAVHFKVRAQGSNQWNDIQAVADADYYSGDSNPVKLERQFTIPIHQRNINFELKVTSDFPYPVSLVSMMWEGNYSPRFYRRA
jgi:hypothetical protein